MTTKRSKENKGTIITWALFRAEFYKRFFPVSYQKDKGAKFENLRQGSMSIEDYVSKFDSLLRFAPHIADNEEAKADQFINGLHLDIFILGNSSRSREALLRARVAQNSSVLDRVQDLLELCVASVEDGTPMSNAEEFLGTATSVNRQDIMRDSVLRKVLTRLRVGIPLDSHLSLARVFALNEDEAQATPNDVITDTGASHSFLSENFIVMHALPVEPMSTFVSVTSPLGGGIVSKLLHRGAEGFLVFAINILKSNPELNDIPVVREFPDVFADEIPGLPPIRKIEFDIDLTTGFVYLFKDIFEIGISPAESS
ncbi:uncharacterized protein [Henckelia pumila]|uniref:uncharacterized protein n=1 Tax=Henckelia pumila TaxID=405737 RepID=UPI003C6E8269